MDKWLNFFYLYRITDFGVSRKLMQSYRSLPHITKNQKSFFVFCSCEINFSMSWTSFLVLLFSVFNQNSIMVCYQYPILILCCVLYNIFFDELFSHSVVILWIVIFLNDFCVIFCFKFIYFILFFTAQKVSMFGVILACIFPHSVQIRTRVTSNTDTFHAVLTSE